MATLSALPCAMAQKLPITMTDDTVLATVQKRANRPPRLPTADINAAMISAQRWISVARTQHDPRAYGYAQQALAPWWTRDDAPADLLRLRAAIKQADHHFEAALKDLSLSKARSPDTAQTHLDLAILLSTMARYGEARASCQSLAKLSRGLIPTLCTAHLDGIEGRAAPARAQLLADLNQSHAVDAATRSWASTLVAELSERIGDHTQAHASYTQALRLNPEDLYARIAFADFLLDAQQPNAVVALFRFEPDALPDAALLRLAIATRQLNATNASALAEMVRNRLAASAQRGESPHSREQALAALKLDDAPQRATSLALKNWQTQKEPFDALLLLACARAAGDAPAIAIANQWLQTTQFQHPTLTATRAIAPRRL